MHHRTSVAPGARPRAASPASPSANGTPRSTPSGYLGQAPLDAPEPAAPAFDWRAGALLLLAAAIAWLGWVAFTGPAPSPSDASAAAAEVAR